MRWLNGLLGWVREEARGKDVFLVVVAAVALGWFWTFGALVLIHLFDAGALIVQGNMLTPNIYSPAILLGSAFFEELLFRLPLAIFVRMGWSLEKVFVVAVVLSLLFGFLHGGISHIFLQGVSGFIFSVVFLKCGGWQRNYAKALIASTVTHFMFNAVLIWL